MPRIPPEFLAAERRALGDAWYRQEYGCEFLASADTVFRPEDIARMLAADAEPLFPGARRRRSAAAASREDRADAP